jgi:hypothetical protein
MGTRPQTYRNHRRLPPPLFIVAFTILYAEVVVRLVELVRHPSLASGWALAVAVALVAVAYYARHNAQIVQDRVIRDEVRLRLERVLPAERHGDIARLALPQLVALRFASDAELPALVQDALAQSLGNGEIKRRITGWQADWLRV